MITVTAQCIQYLDNSVVPVASTPKTASTPKRVGSYTAVFEFGFYPNTLPENYPAATRAYDTSQIVTLYTSENFR